MSIDYIHLASTFVKNGWKWTFKDGQRVPTLNEIETQVSKMREQLAGIEFEEGSTPQVEVGRLLMYRDADTYTLYVLEGDLGPQTD